MKNELSRGVWDGGMMHATFNYGILIKKYFQPNEVFWHIISRSLLAFRPRPVCRDNLFRASFPEIQYVPFALIVHVIGKYE